MAGLMRGSSDVGLRLPSSPPAMPSLLPKDFAKRLAIQVDDLTIK